MLSAMQQSARINQIGVVAGDDARSSPSRRGQPPRRRCPIAPNRKPQIEPIIPVEANADCTPGGPGTVWTSVLPPISSSIAVANRPTNSGDAGLPATPQGWRRDGEGRRPSCLSRTAASTLRYTWSRKARWRGAMATLRVFERSSRRTTPRPPTRPAWHGGVMSWKSDKPTCHPRHQIFSFHNTPKSAYIQHAEGLGVQK